MKVEKILQKLIRAKSITPDVEDALKVVEELTAPLGFKGRLFEYTYEKDESWKCKNMFLKSDFKNKFEIKERHFCFSGHVDVVPTGDENSWLFPPFDGVINKGMIYGCGVVDMKGAVACFIKAAENFINEYKDKINGTISMLIAGDEEAPKIAGTKKMLEDLNKTEKLDFAIVGEPTGFDKIGDHIKVGRRGVIHLKVIAKGLQGHAAYPQKTINPVHILSKFLSEIQDIEFDKGNEFFEPTSLQETVLKTSSEGVNVVPEFAEATIDIRYNNMHTKDKIIDILNTVIKNMNIKKGSIKIEELISADVFLTDNKEYVNMVRDAVNKATGLIPKLNTGGGSSDARFIKDFCPVIEVGLKVDTMHKINECSSIEDLNILTKIYYEILKKFFSV